MEALFWLTCAALMIGCMVYKAIAKKEQEKKETELLERNPDAWKVAKAFELEKTDRSRQAGFGIAITILKILFGK